MMNNMINGNITSIEQNERSAQDFIKYMLCYYKT